MSFKTKKILSTVVLIIIIAFFVHYVVEHVSGFKQLVSLDTSLVWPVSLIAGMILFSLLLNGILLHVLLQPFGVKLTPKEWFGLSLVTNFYNLITPFRGGAVVRAVYLKKKYDFPYVHFFATLGATYIIVLLVGSTTGMISMLSIWILYDFFNLFIFLIFAAISLSLFLVVTFSPRLPERKNKWLNKIVQVINGWHMIRDKKKIIWTTGIISFLQIIDWSIFTIIAFYVFGIKLGFLEAVFLSSVNSFAILISITPGNLGVADAINVFSAALLQIRVPEAVAAVVLKRAIRIVVVSMLGPMFSWILLKRKAV